MPRRSRWLVCAHFQNFMVPCPAHAHEAMAHMDALTGGGGGAWLRGCAGFNYFGQLGDGTTTDRWVPTPISGSYSFAQITAALKHTCGVLTDGTGLCWGKLCEGHLVAMEKGLMPHSSRWLVSAHCQFLKLNSCHPARPCPAMRLWHTLLH